MNVKNAGDCFSKDFFSECCIQGHTAGCPFMSQILCITGIQQEGNYTGGFMMIQRKVDKTFALSSRMF